jgi:hypothetical protein
MALLALAGCSKDESKYPTEPASATAVTGSSGTAQLDFGSHFIIVSVVDQDNQPVSDLTVNGYLLKRYLYVLVTGNNEYYSNHKLVPYSEMRTEDDVSYGPKPASPQIVVGDVAIMVSGTGPSVYAYSEEAQFQDEIVTDEWVTPTTSQGTLTDLKDLAGTMAVNQNILIRLTDDVAFMTNTSVQTVAMVTDSAAGLSDTAFSIYINTYFHIFDSDDLSLSYATYQDNIIPVIFITDLNPGSGFVFAQINLIWGEFPQDLDAHLWTPTIEGFSYHVYFGNPGDLSGVPYAAYDMDADAGWGPERIVIGQAFPGTYYFSVQQYAGESTIPLSGAMVSLIKPDRTVAEFSPPDSAGTGEGWYWHVCRIDGATGEITEINTMTQSPPVSVGVIEPLPTKSY